MKNREQINPEIERWSKETLKPHMAKAQQTDKTFVTTSAIEIPICCFPPRPDEENYMKKLGFPGEFPFTRGIYPNMYRGRLWTFRQYAGYGTCEETNRRFKYLLSQGQTGLSVAFDLPTQMGYDSDNPICIGEVGRAGVAIDTIEDLDRLFADIPLDKVSVSMTINSTAPILLGMYVALADSRGIPRSKLAGTVQNDVLKEYIARGTYIFPPKPSLKLTADVFSYCSKHMPKWNTISISGYHIREAGATAVQEVAFTLANGRAYIEHAIGTGLSIDDFAPRISFFFSSHSNLFEEVAKFRAARRLWASIVRERFGSNDPRSCMLRFHTQTAGSTLTAQQPLNNIIRVTLQALAAVLGGTQSLHTNSFDEALALPTEQAAKIALRTQQIIGFESGVADNVDPLGGSYFIEYLTEEIERRAQEYIAKIDRMGGVVKAIENGYMKAEIEKSAYEYQKKIERCESIVVGVNRFIDEDQQPEILRIDTSLEQLQKKRLQSIRRNRSQSMVKKTIHRIREAAIRGENLIEPIIEAAKQKATIGEICDVLREIYGTFKEVE
ncbi:MAG: acyl-CoA mutase large subunit family protein [bacterium]